jgi:hypothetical protein
MGRPRLELDSQVIEQAAACGLTVDEISTLCNTTRQTLYNQGWIGTIERGRTRMVQSLKRKQYELAMAGDKTMLIWLGKQYCGQSDKVEQQTSTRGEITLRVIEDADYFGNRDRLNELVGENGNGRLRL